MAGNSVGRQLPMGGGDSTQHSVGNNQQKLPSQGAGSLNAGGLRSIAPAFAMLPRSKVPRQASINSDNPGNMAHSVDASSFTTNEHRSLEELLHTDNAPVVYSDANGKLYVHIANSRGHGQDILINDLGDNSNINVVSYNQYQNRYFVSDGANIQWIDFQNGAQLVNLEGFSWNRSLGEISGIEFIDSDTMVVATKGRNTDGSIYIVEKDSYDNLWYPERPLRANIDISGGGDIIFHDGYIFFSGPNGVFAIEWSNIEALNGRYNQEIQNVISTSEEGGDSEFGLITGLYINRGGELLGISANGQEVKIDISHDSSVNSVNKYINIELTGSEYTTSADSLITDAGSPFKSIRHDINGAELMHKSVRSEAIPSSFVNYEQLANLLDPGRNPVIEFSNTGMVMVSIPSDRNVRQSSGANNPNSPNNPLIPRDIGNNGMGNGDRKVYHFLSLSSGINVPDTMKEVFKEFSFKETNKISYNKADNSYYFVSDNLLFKIADDGSISVVEGFLWDSDANGAITDIEFNDVGQIIVTTLSLKSNPQTNEIEKDAKIYVLNKLHNNVIETKGDATNNNENIIDHSITIENVPNQIMSGVDINRLNIAYNSGQIYISYGDRVIIYQQESELDEGGGNDVNNGNHQYSRTEARFFEAVYRDNINPSNINELLIKEINEIDRLWKDDNGGVHVIANGRGFSFDHIKKQFIANGLVYQGNTLVEVEDSANDPNAGESSVPDGVPRTDNTQGTIARILQPERLPVVFSTTEGGLYVSFLDDNGTRIVYSLGDAFKSYLRAYPITATADIAYNHIDNSYYITHGGMSLLRLTMDGNLRFVGAGGSADPALAFHWDYEKYGYIGAMDFLDDGTLIVSGYGGANKIGGQSEEIKLYRINPKEGWAVTAINLKEQDGSSYKLMSDIYSGRDMVIDGRNAIFASEEKGLIGVDLLTGKVENILTAEQCVFDTRNRYNVVTKTVYNDESNDGIAFLPYGDGPIKFTLRSVYKDSDGNLHVITSTNHDLMIDEDGKIRICTQYFKDENGSLKEEAIRYQISRSNIKGAGPTVTGLDGDDKVKPLPHGVAWWQHAKYAEEGSTYEYEYDPRPVQDLDVPDDIEAYPGYLPRRSTYNEIQRFVRQQWADWPKAEKFLQALGWGQLPGSEQLLNSDVRAGNQGDVRTSERTEWQKAWYRMASTNFLKDFEFHIGIWDQSRTGTHTSGHRTVTSRLFGYAASAKNMLSLFKGLFKINPDYDTQVKNNVANSNDLFDRYVVQEQLAKILGMKSPPILSKTEAQQREKARYKAELMDKFGRFIKTMPKYAKFSINSQGGILFKIGTTTLFGGHFPGSPFRHDDYVGGLAKAHFEGGTAVEFSRDSNGLKVTMGATAGFSGVTLEVGIYPPFGNKGAEAHTLAGGFIEGDLTVGQVGRRYNTSTYLDDSNIDDFIGKLSNGNLDFDWVGQNGKLRPDVSAGVDLRPARIHGYLAAIAGVFAPSPMGPNQYNPQNPDAILGIGRTAGVMPNFGMDWNLPGKFHPFYTYAWEANSQGDLGSEYKLKYHGTQSHDLDLHFIFSVWSRLTKVTFPSLSPGEVNPLYDPENAVGPHTQDVSVTWGGPNHMLLLPGLDRLVKQAYTPLRPASWGAPSVDSLPQDNRFTVASDQITADNFDTQIKKYPELSRIISNDPDAKWRLLNALRYKSEGSNFLQFEYELKPEIWEDVEAYNKKMATIEAGAKTLQLEFQKLLSRPEAKASKTLDELLKVPGLQDEARRLQVLAETNAKSRLEIRPERNKIQKLLNNRDNYSIKGYDLMESRVISQKRGAGILFVRIFTGNSAGFSDSIHREEVDSVSYITRATQGHRGYNSIDENKGRALQILRDAMDQNPNQRRSNFKYNQQQADRLRQLVRSGRASDQEKADLTRFEAYLSSLGKNGDNSQFLETLENNRKIEGESIFEGVEPRSIMNGAEAADVAATEIHNINSGDSGGAIIYRKDIDANGVERFVPRFIVTKNKHGSFSLRDAQGKYLSLRNGVKGGFTKVGIDKLLKTFFTAEGSSVEFKVVAARKGFVSEFDNKLNKPQSFSPDSLGTMLNPVFYEKGGISFEGIYDTDGKRKFRTSGSGGTWQEMDPSHIVAFKQAEANALIAPDNYLGSKENPVKYRFNGGEYEGFYDFDGIKVRLVGSDNWLPISEDHIAVFRNSADNDDDGTSIRPSNLDPGYPGSRSNPIEYQVNGDKYFGIYGSDGRLRSKKSSSAIWDMMRVDHLSAFRTAESVRISELRNANDANNIIINQLADIADFMDQRVEIEFKGGIKKLISHGRDGRVLSTDKPLVKITHKIDENGNVRYLVQVDNIGFPLPIPQKDNAIYLAFATAMEIMKPASERGYGSVIRNNAQILQTNVAYNVNNKRRSSFIMPIADMPGSRSNPINYVVDGVWYNGFIDIDGYHYRRTVNNDDGNWLTLADMADDYSQHLDAFGHQRGFIESQYSAAAQHFANNILERGSYNHFYGADMAPHALAAATGRAIHIEFDDGTGREKLVIDSDIATNRPLDSSEPIILVRTMTADGEGNLTEHFSVKINGELVEVPSDGDCLFECVRRAIGSDDSIADLRIMSSEWALRNPQSVAQKVLADADQAGDRQFLDVNVLQDRVPFDSTVDTSGESSHKPSVNWGENYDPSLSSTRLKTEYERIVRSDGKVTLTSRPIDYRGPITSVIESDDVDLKNVIVDKLIGRNKERKQRLSLVVTVDGDRLTVTRQGNTLVDNELIAGNSRYEKLANKVRAEHNEKNNGKVILTKKLAYTIGLQILDKNTGEYRAVTSNTVFDNDIKFKWDFDQAIGTLLQDSQNFARNRQLFIQAVEIIDKQYQQPALDGGGDIIDSTDRISQKVKDLLINVNDYDTFLGRLNEYAKHTKDHSISKINQYISRNGGFGEQISGISVNDKGEYVVSYTDEGNRVRKREVTASLADYINSRGQQADFTANDRHILEVLADKYGRQIQIEFLDPNGNELADRLVIGTNDDGENDPINLIRTVDENGEEIFKVRLQGQSDPVLVDAGDHNLFRAVLWAKDGSKPSNASIISMRSRLVSDVRRNVGNIADKLFNDSKPITDMAGLRAEIEKRVPENVRRKVVDQLQRNHIDAGFADIVHKQKSLRNRVLKSGFGSWFMSAYSLNGTVNGIRLFNKSMMEGAFDTKDPFAYINGTATFLGAFEEILSGAAGVGEAMNCFKLRLPNNTNIMKLFSKAFGGTKGLKALNGLGKLSNLGKIAGPLSILTSAVGIAAGVGGLINAINNDDGWEIAASSFDIIGGGLGMAAGIAALNPATAPAAPFLAMAALVAGAIAQGTRVVRAVEDYENEVGQMSFGDKFAYGFLTFFGWGDTTKWHEELMRVRRGKAITERNQLIADHDKLNKLQFRVAGDVWVNGLMQFPDNGMFVIGEQPVLRKMTAEELKNSNEHLRGLKVSEDTIKDLTPYVLEQGPGNILTTENGFGNGNKVIFYEVVDGYSNPYNTGSLEQIGGDSKIYDRHLRLNTGAPVRLSTLRGGVERKVYGFIDKDNSFVTTQGKGQIYYGNNGSDSVSYSTGISALKSEGKNNLYQKLLEDVIKDYENDDRLKEDVKNNFDEFFDIVYEKANGDANKVIAVFKSDLLPNKDYWNGLHGKRGMSYQNLDHHLEIIEKYKYKNGDISGEKKYDINKIYDQVVGDKSRLNSADQYLAEKGLGRYGENNISRSLAFIGRDGDDSVSFSLNDADSDGNNDINIIVEADDISDDKQVNIQQADQGDNKESDESKNIDTLKFLLSETETNSTMHVTGTESFVIKGNANTDDINMNLSGEATKVSGTVNDRVFVIREGKKASINAGSGSGNKFHIGTASADVILEGGAADISLMGEIKSEVTIRNNAMDQNSDLVIDLSEWADISNIKLQKSGGGLVISDISKPGRQVIIMDRSKSITIASKDSEGRDVIINKEEIQKLEASHSGELPITDLFAKDGVVYLRSEESYNVKLNSNEAQLQLRGQGKVTIDRNSLDEELLLVADAGVFIEINELSNKDRIRFKGVSFYDTKIITEKNNIHKISYKDKESGDLLVINPGEGGILSKSIETIIEYDDGVAVYHTDDKGQVKLYKFHGSDDNTGAGGSWPQGARRLDLYISEKIEAFAGKNPILLNNGMVIIPDQEQGGQWSVYDLQGYRYEGAYYDPDTMAITYTTDYNSDDSSGPVVIDLSDPRKVDSTSKIAPNNVEVLADGRWLFRKENIELEVSELVNGQRDTRTETKTASFIVDPDTLKVFVSEHDYQKLEYREYTNDDGSKEYKWVDPDSGEEIIDEPVKYMWFRYDGARGRHLITDSGSGPGYYYTDEHVWGLTVDDFINTIAYSEFAAVSEETKVRVKGNSTPELPNPNIEYLKTIPSSEYLGDGYYKDNPRLAKLMWSFYSDLETKGRSAINHLSPIFGDSEIVTKVLQDGSNEIFKAPDVVNSENSNDFTTRTMVDMNGDNMDDIVTVINGEIFVNDRVTGEEAGFSDARKLSIYNEGQSTHSLKIDTTDLAMVNFVDIDGDNDKDIIVTRSDGHYIYYNKEGSYIDNPVLAGDVFTDKSDGWNNDDKWPRQFFDINGDKIMDMVAFNSRGVEVALGYRANRDDGSPINHILGIGEDNDSQDGYIVKFGELKSTLGNFGLKNHGWGTNGATPRMVTNLKVRSGHDVMGGYHNNHAPAIIGINDQGVWVSKPTKGPDGNGFAGFTDPVLLSDIGFSTAKNSDWARDWEIKGLHTEEYDYDGDGLLDKIIYGRDGVAIAKGAIRDVAYEVEVTKTGYRMGRFLDHEYTYTTTETRYRKESYFSNEPIMVQSNKYLVRDIDGDNNNDIVEIGYSGIRVALGDGTGGFAAAELISSEYGSNDGWGNLLSNDLLDFVDLNSNGADAIIAIRSDGSTQQAMNLNNKQRFV